MSQQKRADVLVKAAGIPYQRALDHLRELALPLHVEVDYVERLRVAPRVREDACNLGHEFFAPADSDGRTLTQSRRFIVGQDTHEGGFEVSSTWCPLCDRMNEMTNWFFSHYRDPADGVPHDSGEGGYQYIAGGPYDPEEELQEQFPDATPKMIEVAAGRIYLYGWEWVKNEEY